MKKTLTTLLVALTLLACSCGTQMLGNGSSSSNSQPTAKTISSGGLLGNSALSGLLNLVIGKVKLSQDDLIGTWKYNEPGCAFTSENLLAQAGGAVAAEEVKSKLSSAYNSLGINANNTSFTFGKDGRFSARLKGLPLSGTYTFDSANSAVKLQMPLISATGYLTRTANGMAFTFESKKLLSLLQTLAAFSGNSTLQTVGELSKQFDGVRVGMAMRK